MESSQRNNPPPPRKWKEWENTKLVESLLDMVNKGTYKAEKGFKPGWSRSIEKVLSKECPTSGLKAKPHIESRYKVLGRDFTVVHDMLAETSTSGFGIHPETGVLTASDDVWDAYISSHKAAAKWRSMPFPHYTELCTICGKDRATGKEAKTAADIVEELDLLDDAASLDGSKADSGSISSTSDKRKRMRRSNDDALPEVASSIGNKFGIFGKSLDNLAEKMSVDFEWSKKRSNLNKEIMKLTNLSMRGQIKAAAMLAKDNEWLDIFFTFEEVERKEEFVRMLLSGELNR